VVMEDCAAKSPAWPVLFISLFTLLTTDSLSLPCYRLHTHTITCLKLASFFQQSSKSEGEQRKPETIYPHSPFHPILHPPYSSKSSIGGIYFSPSIRVFGDLFMLRFVFLCLNFPSLPSPKRLKLASSEDSSQALLQSTSPPFFFPLQPC